MSCLNMALSVYKFIKRSTQQNERENASKNNFYFYNIIITFLLFYMRIMDRELMMIMMMETVMTQMEKRANGCERLSISLSLSL
jgi:hypothetical protein